jgi:hypothetical protein
MTPNLYVLGKSHGIEVREAAWLTDKNSDVGWR